MSHIYNNNSYILKSKEAHCWLNSEVINGFYLPTQPGQTKPCCNYVFKDYEWFLPANLTWSDYSHAIICLVVCG